MAEAQEQVACRQPGWQGIQHALWSLGCRPFFLAAAVWAAFAVSLWMVVFTTGITLPSRFAAMDWHIHAMLFGFVPAAVAGFLLTAVANWTGRPPISGGRLQALFALWLAGRIACLFSAQLPLPVVVSVDVAFPWALCAVVSWEVIAARHWRNIAMGLPVLLMGLADLLSYGGLAGLAINHGLSDRLGIMATIVLISVIGGRIIPTFTRNWLVQQAKTAPPAAPGWLDRLALGTLHLGLSGWVLAPQARSVGILLVIAAILNAWRLARWHGLATCSAPLLAILHMGYAWVVLGTALLGACILNPIIPFPAAIHALSAGAMGTMIIGVMTRVLRGHTGRPLVADRLTVVLYLMVTTAAVLRVLAAFMGLLPLFQLSAISWILAFGGFVVMYGPMGLLPRKT